MAQPQGDQPHEKQSEQALAFARGRAQSGQATGVMMQGTPPGSLSLRPRGGAESEPPGGAGRLCHKA